MHAKFNWLWFHTQLLQFHVPEVNLQSVSNDRKQNRLQASNGLGSTQYPAVPVDNKSISAYTASPLKKNIFSWRSLRHYRHSKRNAKHACIYLQVKQTWAWDNTLVGVYASATILTVQMLFLWPNDFLRCRFADRFGQALASNAVFGRSHTVHNTLARHCLWFRGTQMSRDVLRATGTTQNTLTPIWHSMLAGKGGGYLTDRPIWRWWNENLQVTWQGIRHFFLLSTFFSVR